MATRSIEKTVDRLNEDVVAAYGAVIDGRLDNLAFKHKQLFAVFKGLQQHLTTLDHAKSSSGILLELEYTLRSISEALDSLPTDLTRRFDREQKLKDIGSAGSRRTARGLVLILVDEKAPISSWAIPLVQAIVDGNATMILAPSSVSLPNIAELDRVAHPSGRNSDGLVDRLMEAAQGNVAIVAPASLSPSRLSVSPSRGSCLELRPTPDGPISIIIDQSSLSRGPLSPAEEASGLIPAPISRVASQIALTLQGDGPVCHGAPTYLLVHENVVKPFVRAMESAHPGIDAKVWELGMNKSKAKSFTQSHHGGSHTFLAIFSVPSIDMAIDFLLNDAPTPPITYVFASPRFASYAYSSLKHIPVVHLNRMPEEALVLGAYAERRQFSFSSEARATYASRPENDRYELKASTDCIERLRARELKQPLGHRIDFFGGSFMFAGGLTASAILAGTGYGIFKVARWVWVWSRT